MSRSRSTAAPARATMISPPGVITTPSQPTSASQPTTRHHQQPVSQPTNPRCRPHYAIIHWMERMMEMQLVERAAHIRVDEGRQTLTRLLLVKCDRGSAPLSKPFPLPVMGRTAGSSQYCLTVTQAASQPAGQPCLHCIASCPEMEKQATG